MRFIARFLSRIGRGENWTENRDTFPLFFVACYCCCCFCQQSFADTICLRQSLVYSIYTYIFLHIYISLLQSDSSPFGCFHLPTDVATFMVDVITFLLLPPLMPCFPISWISPFIFPARFLRTDTAACNSIKSWRLKTICWPGGGYKDLYPGISTHHGIL